MDAITLSLGGMKILHIGHGIGLCNTKTAIFGVVIRDRAALIFADVSMILYRKSGVRYNCP